MQEIVKLKKRINVAKSTILMVAVLTLINIAAIVFDAAYSFPFSAYVPQFVTAVFAGIAEEQGTDSILYIGIAVAVLLSLVYVALWFGAKKKNTFLIVALVFFAIDTAFFIYSLFLYFDASYIIDIAFHAWVIFDLVLGISAYSQLKKIPEQEIQNAEGYKEQYILQGADDTDFSMRTESTPIRLSENKGRVLISSNYNGLNIEVRRSKALTELVIDGKVYAERKGVIESEYELAAIVSGVEIKTAMTTQSVMYLYADGVQIAKKFRLI